MTIPYPTKYDSVNRLCLSTLTWIGVLAVLLFVQMQQASAIAPDAYHALPSGKKSPDPRNVLKKYLLRQAKMHFDARRATVAEIKTVEQLEARRTELMDVLRRINGPFPEKTPLHPQVTGTIDCAGYVIEKVVFEVMPAHHITANFYLPKDRTGKVPGVIIPCGHSRFGKAYPSYQMMGISLAQNGIAALIYDPHGQGERRQHLDEFGQPIVGPAYEHHSQGIGAFLVGQGTANHMIWDGIRAIDYLISRPEIDSDRIGCTGNSGGGTLTAYLMIFDPRIKAAAPSCWLTTQERMFNTIGPQDAEQSFPGQTALGIEHADLLTLRAPHPTLVCVASFDFFEVEGSWESVREAKRFYGLLDAGHALDLFEYPDNHGFSLPRRQAAMRYMRRWLMGQNDNPSEQEMTVQDRTDLLCTAAGQVVAEFGGKTIHHLNLERAELLQSQRDDLWNDPAKAMSEVRRLIGLRLPVATPTVTSHGFVPTEDEIQLGYGTDLTTGIAHSAAQTGTLLTIEKLVLERDGEVPVPGLLMVPMEESDRPRPAVLYVSGLGKPDDMSTGADMARHLDLTSHVTRGKIVLSIDVRGFGETTAESEQWPQTFFGTDYATSMLAINLNRPLLGQRVEDIIAAVNYLTSRADVATDQLELIGHGAAGPAALHATAFDQRIHKLTLDRSLDSWIDVVREPLGQNQVTNVVPFVLEYYDLPQLVNTIKPRNIKILNPVDSNGRLK